MSTIKSSPSRRYLVTGASSGIGLAIVTELHRRQHEVIAVAARPKDKLPASFPDIPYVQADLAVGVQPVVDAAGEVDRLILAAGLGYYRGLPEESGEAIAEVIGVNLQSVVRVLHGLYGTLSRNAGRVALFGSVADRGAAGMPVYSATKGAIQALARSLASEWQERIAVRHFRLWPVRTPMHARAGFDSSRIDFMLMSADHVADLIISALERKGPVDVSVNPATLLVHRLVGMTR